MPPNHPGGAHERTQTRTRGAGHGTPRLSSFGGAVARPHRGRLRARQDVPRRWWLRHRRHARARRPAPRHPERRPGRRRLGGRTVHPGMSEPNRTIRVVVADDQTAVRDGLVMLLELMPGITVLASAADGEEAIELVEEH